MNNKLSIAYLILMITLLFTGCGPVKEKSKNNSLASSISLHVGNDKYVMIDTKESVVTWKGWNVFNPDSQTGYVHISKGELMIEKGQLMGGTVEVDMNTIEDRNHVNDNKLVNHLKDPDFFDVKKFPISTIVITGVSENKKVTGDLTIKGITHPVTFPVRMEIKDGIVEANGKLVIDRTLWDVRYKSGKFYDNLANQTMSDSIEFHIKIVTKKNKNIAPSVVSDKKYIYTKYEYTDAIGKRLIVQNSFPKGGLKYTDPKGKAYIYAIFWTRIINETDNPFKLMIDFPADSFELPSAPGRYFRIFLPSDTLTPEKEDLFNYGLPVLNSFLDKDLQKASSLQRTINPKDSSAFYVVALSTRGVDGVLRTELSLKGQDIFYRINDKEIYCGKINLKKLMLQK